MVVTVATVHQSYCPVHQFWYLVQEMTQRLCPQQCSMATTSKYKLEDELLQGMKMSGIIQPTRQMLGVCAPLA
ncbi:unnamed protein product [Strongylus vulgaris]|uniref:Uncharacterized protein n=1 Tax=Strongylus vulgaris TaxID=40348 RepID=A0A3P7ITY4_STRVU|nr:unnamed protein product [Strongylus vulgaris]